MFANNGLLCLLCLIGLALCQGQAQPAKESGCSNKKCDPFAEYCINNECKCITECPAVAEDAVCTSSGKEYASRCEFYRDQCLCKGGQAKCTNKGVENDHILFYGMCANRQIRRSNSNTCKQYNSRLAKWFEMMLRVRQAQRYDSAQQQDDYSMRLYQTELKMYKKLDSNEQSMSRTVVMHGRNTATYDPRLVTFWYCSLDSNSDGILDEREQSQITRILLPACPCIEDFLNTCRNGDQDISMEEFLGGSCFNIAEDKQTKTCEALRLNPSFTS